MGVLNYEYDEHPLEHDRQPARKYGDSDWKQYGSLRGNLDIDFVIPGEDGGIPGAVERIGCLVTDGD